jgi:NADH dehydrogenase FAD-containing subunit
LTTELIESLGKEQSELQGVARGRVAVDRWLRAIGGNGCVFALGDCSCITEDQLPATGQVAAQQAAFIADMMNKNYTLSPPKMQDGTLPPPKRDPERQGSSLAEAIASIATHNDEYAKPFQYLNLGILAYTGSDTALAQVLTLPNKPPAITSTGKLGNALWQSVYLGKQISWRNRVLVLSDWFKRSLFGRDITQL